MCNLAFPKILVLVEPAIKRDIMRCRFFKQSIQFSNLLVYFRYYFKFFTYNNFLSIIMHDLLKNGGKKWTI